MTIHFNIHSVSTTNAPTSTPTQPFATPVKKEPEPNQVKDTKEKQVSDESVSIAAFTGDAPSSSPYSALLNPEGFDFENMSINEFKGIVDAIRTLESDMARSSGYTGSLRDTFWDDVMGVKGSLDGVNFEEKGFKPDEKINIIDFFVDHVEGAAQMEKENYRSFHGVLGNAQKKQQTVAKITSESFLQEYQEKVINFLKSQETKLVDTQA
ncbi:hypothetical protein EXT48_14765 [Pseudoalteromonas sp. CO348]|uniref:hypothetical protein n=1 Tax=Pseudoalteromonas TaxID=53246 RepID=UPI001023F26A|nr:MULTISPECIES: hypothetical protein [Pseudoalteromonas]MCG7539023.1 hypothetical protein [Pseudoalteromonas sp. OF7H-1]MCG9769939.1 hypothetical protein [Pseudoalteromonas piscicida]RZG03262.1 hypothetical protein EXT48_14765 [Pseudoalteromonas sp. CO348]